MERHNATHAMRALCRWLPIAEAVGLDCPLFARSARGVDTVTVVHSSGGHVVREGQFQ
jgi:hypothetical protein